MATIRKRTWINGKGDESKRFVVDYYDAEAVRQRKFFDTRAEADAFRIEVEGQLRDGTFRPKAVKITVREVADLFLAHCKARLKRGERMTQRNYQVYEGYIRNYIAPDREWHRTKHAKPSHAHSFFEKGIGHKTLAQLTVGTVTKLRDDLRAHGLSVPTTRKIIAMLQVMLTYAVSLDLTVFNPAKDVEVIGRRDEGAKQITPPDKRVVRELIALADADFAVRLMFAAATGVRAGELHALRWKHINVRRREARIETRVDPYGNEDVPKTVAGIRTIPLGAGVLSALNTWRERTSFPDDNDILFPNHRGSYTDHRNMVTRMFEPLFRRLAERWEVDRRNEPLERFSWHAIRHFAISCWIEAGLPPKAVQTFAGHSSLQVTMDRYGHLFPSDSHNRAMDAIADEFCAPSPPAGHYIYKKDTDPRLG